MAWVETRITRTTQPQDACGIDPASTLGRNFLDGRLGDSFTSLKNVPCELNPFDFPKRVDSVGKYIISHGNGSVSFRLGVPAISSATELTWVNVLTIPSSEVGATRRLTGNCYANYGVNRGLSLMMDSGGVVGVIFAGSGGLTTLMGAPASLDKSEVISVVVKRDGAAAEVSLYQGGRLTNSGTGSYTPHHVWELSGAGDDRGLQTANGTRHHLMAYFAAAPSASEIKSLADNPWQIFEPEVIRIWVDDYVSAGGGATVIPIGVQATGSVGTPSATGAARATPAGVSASSAVGAPVAVGGASIPATALPAGVQATAAIGTVTARGAAVALPAGVTATGAVGTPSAVAGTSIPATVLPAGVQASSAVGTPTAKGAAIAQPLGVAAIAYVGTPTIATGVSGVAVCYPAGVQAIGQVGTLITTGAAWTAAVGVQAVASVGTPFAYAGALISTTAGAQTRPSRLQSSGRASRIQTGTRASR